MSKRKPKKVSRRLGMYLTYNWKNHDPVLDRMRTAWQSSKLSIDELSWMSGVSRTTLRNWFVKVNVRRPYHDTVAAVLNALHLWNGGDVVVGGKVVDMQAFRAEQAAIRKQHGERDRAAQHN